MASIFGNMPNTGITGIGMPNVGGLDTTYANGIMGQVNRRRNRRPDTWEEMAADAAARGEPPPVQPGAGTTIFNQPQTFPGENFGQQDFTRAGTYLGNEMYNRFGDIYNRGWDLYNTAGNLYNKFDALAEQANLGGLAQQVGSIRSGVLSGQMPQFVEQMIAPYLAQGEGKIQSGVTTATRQAMDMLPRAAAAESIMGTLGDAVKGKADLYSSLYAPIASSLVSDAMAAGDPLKVASLYGQQGAALGQQGNLLGQQGTIAGQQALGPFSILQGVMAPYTQRAIAEMAGKAGKK